MRTVVSVCLLLSLFCCIGPWTAASQPITPDDFNPGDLEDKRYRTREIGWKWVFILAAVPTIYISRTPQARKERSFGTIVFLYFFSVIGVCFLLGFFSFRINGW